MAGNGSIESLTLEINARSEGAEKAVDKLISTLERLQTKTANLGLGNVGTQLKGIQKAASGFGSEQAAGMERILRALEKLQTLSNIKISSSIGNQLNKLIKAAEQIKNTDAPAEVQRLADALKELSGIGKISIGPALNQLNKLPDISKNLEGVDMEKFAAQIRKVTEALKPLATEMDKVSRGFSAFPEKLKRVLAETDKIPESNTKAALSYENLAAKVSLTIHAVQQIWNIIEKVVNFIGEEAETVNLFNVSMGQYAEEAGKYAENVARLLGIDPLEFMKNQGVLMSMATGFGVAGDEAYKMSQNLTQLGYDLSSLFNMDVATATQKIQSGLAGEIEPLRTLGYDLSNARLQQIALANGIDKTVESMTQAEKASLRYLAIMSQQTQAHGDLARTMDSLMNQWRQLKTAVTEAARAIGNLLLPIVQIIVPILTEAAYAVRDFANSLALILGIEPITEQANAFADVVTSIEDANGSLDTTVNELESVESGITGATKEAAKFKKMLLGIDELNVLNEKTGETAYGGTGTGVLGALGYPAASGDWRGQTNSPLYNFENPEFDYEAQLKKLAADYNFFKNLGATENQLNSLEQVVSILGGTTEQTNSITEETGNIWSEIFEQVHQTTSEVTKFAGKTTALTVASAGILTVRDWGRKLLGGKVSKDAGKAAASAGKTAASKTAKAADWVDDAFDGAVGAGGMHSKSFVDDMVSSEKTAKLTKLKSTFGKVAQGVAGLGLAYAGSTAQIDAFMKVLEGGSIAKDAGILFEDYVGNVANVAGMAIAGNSLGQALIGGAAGGIAAGSKTLATGLLDATTNGLNLLNGMQIMGSAAEIGASIGSAVGGPIGAGVGAGLGVAAAGIMEFQVKAEESAEKIGVDFNESLAQIPLQADTGFFQPMQSGFFALGQFIADKALGTKNDLVSKSQETMSGTENSYLNPSREKHTSLFSYIGEKAASAKERIVSAFSAANSGVTSAFFNPVQATAASTSSVIDSNFVNLGTKIATSFQTASTKVRTSFQNLGTWFNTNVATPIGDALTRLNNSITTVMNRSSAAQYNSSNTYRGWAAVNTYATGGFPSVGEMFVARERGPELVGRIGNQTAVANNGQIISGIKQGVYEAMMAAGGGQGANISVNVNGRNLLTIVAEEARRETIRTGVNPLTQGG